MLVDGVDLVVEQDGQRRSGPLTTVRAAAAFTGVEPGAPADVYEPATPVDLDVPLVVDPDAAGQLARFFAAVAEALGDLCARHADEAPATVQLWPEHFDLATTISEVNHGGSPGDEGHPLPYLYVGPWEAHDGPFWNEPFGASLGLADVDSVDTAVAFFRQGLAQL